MDSVPDLPVGDLLAPADDLPVGRVLLDEGRPLLHGQVLHTGHPLAAGVKVRVFGQAQLLPDKPRQVLPNGRGAGQSRGLDARRVEEARGALPQDEVIPVLVGPQAGERGDDLPGGDVLHPQGGFLQHLLKPLGGGGGVLPAADILGGGAQQQVAVDRGGDQHPLAVFPGQLEHRAGHMAPGGVVQQAVLAPAGGDMQLVRADPVVHFIGEHPGGVDHRPGGIVPPAGVDHPALFPRLQAGDLGVKGELHPVFGGALRQAQGQLKGAHNARGVGQQGPFHFLRKVGL